MISEVYDEWHPELIDLVDSYGAGDVDLEEVSEHVMEMPDYRFKTDDGELDDDRWHRLKTATGKLYENGPEEMVDWNSRLGFMLWHMEHEF